MRYPTDQNLQRPLPQGFNPYRVEYERPEIEQYTVFVNTPLLESPGGGFGGDEGGLDEEDLDD